MENSYPVLPDRDRDLLLSPSLLAQRGVSPLIEDIRDRVRGQAYRPQAYNDRPGLVLVSVPFKETLPLARTFRGFDAERKRNLAISRHPLTFLRLGLANEREKRPQKGLEPLLFEEYALSTEGGQYRMVYHLPEGTFRYNEANAHYQNVDVNLRTRLLDIPPEPCAGFSVSVQKPGEPVRRYFDWGTTEEDPTANFTLTAGKHSPIATLIAYNDGVFWTPTNTGGIAPMI